MTDIQYWDDTLQEDIEAIQTMLEKMNSISDAVEKTNAIDRCKERIRAAAGTKRSFKMEIRLVQDVNQRRQYESRLNGLDQQLKTLQADLQAIEAEHLRGELMQEGDVDLEQQKENGVKAGDKMLAEAHAIQEKTQDSLANTKELIAQSKEVGVATLEELERQREVIQSIERETDRIDDNLARAEALLKQFGKRMAGDYFIQCMMAVNVLLLIGVIVYAIIRKQGSGGEEKEEPKPQSPVRW